MRPQLSPIEAPAAGWQKPGGMPVRTVAPNGENLDAFGTFETQLRAPTLGPATALFRRYNRSRRRFLPRTTMKPSEIQAGQIWRSIEAGDEWLVTRVYGDFWERYAVLRKLSGAGETRRVKIHKEADGAELPGFGLVQG